MSLCCPEFHPLRQFARQLKLGAKVAGSVDQSAFCGHRIRRWEKLSACKYYYLRRKSVSWISDGIWWPEQHLSQDNFWFNADPCIPEQERSHLMDMFVDKFHAIEEHMCLEAWSWRRSASNPMQGLAVYKQIIRNLNHWKAGTSYTSIFIMQIVRHT